MNLSMFFTILAVVLELLAGLLLWQFPTVDIRQCLALAVAGMASFAAGHLPV